MSAELLPGARIVRAFNAVGADRMGQAHEEPGRVGMPIAGRRRRSPRNRSPTLIRGIGTPAGTDWGARDGQGPSAGNASGS